MVSAYHGAMKYIKLSNNNYIVCVLLSTFFMKVFERVLLKVGICGLAKNSFEPVLHIISIEYDIITVRV